MTQNNDKRKYKRFSCSIKSSFEFFEGNPDEIDPETHISEKGKGLIIDISCGGIFLISNSKVSPGLPIIMKFQLNKEKLTLNGRIVRTGLLRNNPSEIAQKFSSYASKGENYIAVEFDAPLLNYDFSTILK
ncbi:MAG TPA: PilZ domain-containing protein [Spirochaetota bacterium]|nr:PilZ domain-containing protein [Spirochaetota bacterium]HPJ33621.1 PilZ domain-containing protein [Spirochaetota bacterium]